MKRLILFLCLSAICISGFSQRKTASVDGLRVKDSIVIGYDNFGNRYILPLHRGSANSIATIPPSGSPQMIFQSIDTLVLNDSALIAGIVNIIVNDTNLMNQFVNSLTNNTNFLNTLINNILNDQDFINSLTTIIANDTNLINTLITNIINDQTFINSLISTIINDTSFINNIVTNLFANNTFQSYLNNYLDTYLTTVNIDSTNLDSLYAADSVIMALLDSLITAGGYQININRWIRNQVFDSITPGTTAVQNAWAWITGPFNVLGSIRGKFIFVGPPGATGGGLLDVTGNSNFRGSVWIQPANLGSPDLAKRKGYFLPYTGHDSYIGRVPVMDTIPGTGGVLMLYMKPLDSISSKPDTIIINYCNGCLNGLPFAFTNDSTITADTAGLGACTVTYNQSLQQLILCGDTVVFTFNNAGIWLKQTTAGITSAFLENINYRAGIGTTAPREMLEVKGNFYLDGTVHIVGSNGDVNNSGITNSADATIISHYADNTGTYTGYTRMINGDIDGNGIITYSDAMAALGIFTGSYGATLSAQQNKARSLFAGCLPLPFTTYGFARYPIGLLIGGGWVLNATDSIPSNSGRNVFGAGGYSFASPLDFSKMLMVKLTGKVGIGTDIPSSKLDVRGGVSLDSLRLRNIPAGTSVGNLGYDASGNVVIGSAGTSITVPISNLIYVDAKSGSDVTGRVGNVLKPFATLRTAIDSFVEGQCIVVMPGTYNVETTSNSNEGTNLIRKSNGNYLTGARYYFYPGARVIKSNGYNLIDGTVVNGLRIFGGGTFIRQSNAGSGGKVARFSNSYIYWEADTVRSTVGEAITDNGYLNQYRIRYCISSTGYALYAHSPIIYGGSWQGTGAAHTIELDPNNALDLYNVTDITASISASNASYSCIHGISKVRGRINAIMTGTTGLYLDVSNHEIEFNCYFFNGTNVIDNTGGRINFTDYTGYVHIIKQNSGNGVINYNGTNAGGMRFIVAGGTVNINGYTNFLTDYVGNPMMTITAGIVNINGVHSWSGQRNNGITISGGTLAINGKIWYNTTDQQLPTQRAFITCDGGTIILGAGSSIKLISGGDADIQGIINFRKNATLITKGGIMQPLATDYYSLMVGPMKGVTGDTVAVSYYNEGTTFLSMPFFCRPYHEGTVVFNTGYDFSANNKSFVINVNGAGNVTINLTSNCAALADILTLINTQLAAGGITTIEAVAGQQDIRDVTLRSKFTGNENQYTNKFEIVSGTALTLFGWTASTYKASIYKKIATGPVFLYDSNVITD